MSTIKDTWTSIGHSVNCPTHGPLVETTRHCHNLARFLLSSNSEGLVSSWFQLASGITEVVYISHLYDETVNWCRPAYEYEESRSNYHSKLIREFTRFNFIWGGFEALCDSLNLPVCPDQKKRGIIHNVNFHLKCLDENGSFPEFQFYNQVLEHLRKLIGRNPWYGNVNELFAHDSCSCKNFVGLKVVYKIRNLFAHGAFKFNELYAGIESQSYDDIKIISASSRILLLTLQMLIYSTSKDLKIKVPELHYPPDEGPIAKNFLIKLHLKSYKYS